MKENVIKTKIFAFALRVIKLYQYISQNITEIRKLLTSIIKTFKLKKLDYSKINLLQLSINI